MASFRAYLSVGGKFETDLNAFTMQVYQHIDELGRPASATLGGKMTVTFNVTTDPLVAGWMINPAQQHSGTVTFYDLDGITMKELHFKNAHCVDMETGYDGTDTSMHMETTLVISPEKLAIGPIDHDNNWADIEAF